MIWRELYERNSFILKLHRMPRVTDNGMADGILYLIWHFALYNQRIRPTQSGKACGFPAVCGLSAAPLGVFR